jgi:hypothetical protein
VKRENCLVDRIADPDNLRLAFWKAGKSKTGKAEVIEFQNNLDKNLLSLRSELLGGKPAVGNYRYFKVFDPKERLICASAFRERVLHHALMNVCHDSFERFQIYDSYACRIGKGTYAALDRAETFQKRYAWFLKLDVRKYFASISHNILKGMLQRRFKERRLLDIFGAIVDSYEAAPQRGLPIGNLTSQYYSFSRLYSLPSYNATWPAKPSAFPRQTCGLCPKTERRNMDAGRIPTSYFAIACIYESCGCKSMA